MAEILLGQWLGGHLVELHPLGVVHPAPIGGKRSSVDSFSPAARRRLQRLLASLRVEVFDFAQFVTFTYPDEFPGQVKRHRDWDVMEKRLARLIPGVCGIWRLEFKPRKSGLHVGEIAPHYHLLSFGTVGVLDPSWLSEAWFDVVGSGDVQHLWAGTSVESCYNRERAAIYLCKYAAKEWDEVIPESGRRWGVLGDLSKIRGELVYQKVGRKEGAKVARVCDGVRRGNIRRRKKKSGGAVKWSRKRASLDRSAFWFQDATSLNEKLSAISGLSAGAIESATFRVAPGAVQD